MERFVLDMNTQQTAEVFGQGDAHIAIIEDAFGVEISLNDEGVSCVPQYEDEHSQRRVELAMSVIGRMVELSKQGEVLNRQITAYLCDLAAENGPLSLSAYQAGGVCVTSRGKSIKDSR